MINEELRVGSSSRAFHGRADEDAVAAFALATNDANDRYLKGDAAPPMFTAGLIMPALWESQQRGGERDAVQGASSSVHGEHDVTYWGVVKPGMDLRWKATATGAKQVRGGVVVTHRIMVTGSDGSRILEHVWSNFHVGGTIHADVGSELADHIFPEAARIRPAGTETIALARDQAFRYAGVSGDHTGHALDDETARDEGYPSKILQGMCTFSICSGAMVDLGAAGDVSRLRRFAGRFSAPAFPRKDLVIAAYDGGSTADGLRILAFEAIQNGVVVIKHGRVEFATA